MGRLMNRRLAATFVCFSFPLNFLTLQARPQLQSVRQGQPAEIATVQDSDEYAVWSILLVWRYTYRNHQTFVIRDRTATDTNPRDLLPYAYLSEEAFSDFQAKNKEQYRLENKLSVTTPCVFISKEKEDSLFPTAHITSIDSDSIEQMQNNWNQFYQQYPGMHGIVTFSRVGFNSDKSQAVVYVRYDGGIMTHRGEYFVFAHKNGSWEIQTQKLIWIS
jgi:hypothetical protein